MLWRGSKMQPSDELIKALQAIQLPSPINIEYRFYYDETGKITTCSQFNHQEYGEYLIVTEHEYNHYYQYYIDKNKLKMIDINHGYRVQLKHSDQGYCVVKNHAGIVLAVNETHNDVEYYDTTN